MSKNKSRIDKSVMKWQTGDLNPVQTITIDLPVQLLMLCKVINVSPTQLITDFMDNLASGSWNRQGRDKAKQLLTEYFIEHGYGSKNFSIEDLKTIFRELDAIGLLFPKGGDEEMMESYAKWREHYQEYWVEKWLNKGDFQ